MSTFILVHGGFHGGWCWELVAPHLRRAGHTVYAPDLPGHGADQTPQAEVTFEKAVNHIGKIVNGTAEPTILVAHSMSGLIISQVAENWPDKVKRLVWVSAFLCPSDYSLKDYLDENQHLAQSQVLPNAVPSADGTHFSFRADRAKEVFYSTTPDDIADRATKRLCPVALPYLVTPVKVTAGNFGRIPRAYVVSLQDRALPPAIQRKMIAEHPCDPVFELDTDHSPFESRPERLAECLLQIA